MQDYNELKIRNQLYKMGVQNDKKIKCKKLT
jgi:hypothetical protein